jgi:hypothetical protein
MGCSFGGGGIEDLDCHAYGVFVSVKTLAGSKGGADFVEGESGI